VPDVCGFRPNWVQRSSKRAHLSLVTANILAGQEIGADWDVFVRAVVTPTVDSVKPATLRRGDTKILRIRGTGFIAPMTVLVPEAEGVTVQSVTVISETKTQGDGQRR
jgi:hypothetical protein